MTLDDFRRTLSATQPPGGLSAALTALWWARKGDWDASHRIVMDEPGRGAAWVHAYLHRIEGDAANAAYWYRCAGRPCPVAALEPEWGEIAQALLESS